jgi:hypothetical protein
VFLCKRIACDQSENKCPYRVTEITFLLFRSSSVLLILYKTFSTLVKQYLACICFNIKLNYIDRVCELITVGVIFIIDKQRRERKQLRVINFVLFADLDFHN